MGEAQRIVLGLADAIWTKTEAGKSRACEPFRHINNPIIAGIDMEKWMFRLAEYGRRLKDRRGDRIDRKTDSGAVSA